MKLRQKVILLAITPLIIALIAIALAVRYQATVLADQQRASVEAAYLASKEAELRHYVALATQSIDHLYDSGRKDEATLNEAKAILAKLNFGDDGYFFVYDLNGNNLMHPRQPELIGRNLWEMRDASGRPTIQLLTARAKEGGGFQRYLWEKPSAGKIAPKLGYVVMLERWGWMLGTGIYMDDVDAAISKIDTQISGNIHNTMIWIAGIAITGALIIAISGLALNISEYRVADAKLKALAQRVVRSQEDERARLSRDLHDSISQLLVSIKLQIESGIAKLSSHAARPEFARLSFDRAAGQLNDVLGEVRRISHDLRPALLDDLGLAAALDHLTREFSEHSSLSFDFENIGTTDGLSDVGNTVLFRIAQEALTNIKRHAVASHASVRLVGNNQCVQLLVSDNGVGFDVAQIAQHPKRGIGLRNMHERLEAVGGKLLLTSSADGTQVIATLPRS
ncbi:MAG TPA: cache domain-containing protein [Noviherbaspirillum sp.]|jgi:two-component system NarL family sensor kinase|uniref:cache domain-containing protein n=1 Tax=Noviherbaspirillum sp. TaxID=1926288 RepID=UPI002DDDB50F|nr:cache domain-containing protein [Noviherbaspirillum sp.]HEV2609383.1 cache domain-containing protein [Noviherbaspirillum sp.]